MATFCDAIRYAFCESVMTEHFIIAGAQRSGTTYLYQLLSRHPQIEMAVPLKPEPKFFLNEDRFRRGMDDYRRRFFSGKPTAVIKGEKSTSYIESEAAARRISATLPNAKIIFLLRNPIHRAVSNYRFSVENGLETLSMHEAFVTEEKRLQANNPHKTSVSPYAYLKRGRYMDYLSMYSRYFPRENMKILIFERLVGQWPAFRDLFAFLGVDDRFHPADLDKVVNPSKNRMQSLLTPELVRFLDDYFSESNRALAGFLHTDLTEWAIDTAFPDLV
jgi:hypothetical protein